MTFIEFMERRCGRARTLADAAAALGIRPETLVWMAEIIGATATLKRWELAALADVKPTPPAEPKPENRPENGYQPEPETDEWV